MTSIPTTHGRRIDRLKANTANDVTSECCGTCRFWLPDQPLNIDDDSAINLSDYASGYCRRRPPVVVESLARLNIEPPRFGTQTDQEEGFSASALLDSSTFPGSYATQWCGEYDRLRNGSAA